jgi:hypothetical protein
LALQDIIRILKHKKKLKIKVMKQIEFDIKTKHESQLYKLITDISEDLRDEKEYSEEEIRTFLVKMIEQIINES